MKHLEEYMRRCALHPGAYERFEAIIKADLPLAVEALREAMDLAINERMRNS